MSPDSLSPRPVRLFDSTVLSGNGYKARLALHLRGLEVEIVELDIFGARETRAPEFLRKNPNGRIPLLELDDGSFLPESNAILCFVAQGTDLWPSDPLAQARVLSWLFFEQYSHEPYLAVLRAWRKYFPEVPRTQSELEAKHAGSLAALGVLEATLADRDYLVGGRFSVADIALYPYTKLAPEAGLSLAEFPRVQAWLERIESRPGHLPLERPTLP